MFTLVSNLWPRAFAWLAQVQSAPEVKFFTLKDPDPDRGLAWFVLNAFFFVGVALAVTLGIGLVFGSFRLWLLARFPNNWFNGAPADDVSKTFRLTSPEE